MPHLHSIPFLTTIVAFMLAACATTPIQPITTIAGNHEMHIVALQDPPAARVGATLVAIATTGRAYLVGGEDPRTGMLEPTVWSFDLHTGAARQEPLTVQRSAHGAALHAQELWLVGGRCERGYCDDALRLTLPSLQTSSIAMEHIGLSPRTLPAVASFADGVVVFGGRTSDDAVLGDGVRWSTATNSATPLPLEHAPRARAEALLLVAGERLLLWGGASPDEQPSELRGAALDRSPLRWTTLVAENGPMPATGHVAAVAGDALVVRSQDALWRLDLRHDRWETLVSQGFRGASVVAWRGQSWSLTTDGALWSIASDGRLQKVARIAARHEPLIATTDQALLVLGGYDARGPVQGGVLLLAPE